MWLLAESGQKELADATGRKIIRKALQDGSPGKFGDKHFGKGLWEHDSAAWIAARLEMGEALSAGAGERKTTGDAQAL